ncbi:DUF389 domain-containing protein [Nocardia yamanashiensis]|uniref:DUF389 domain-containing protein n=1 Tax=Nocardia yamanashiensis TaxID=209247 RepID=UPI001E52415F|nr:DUF389 domain-containing protein [Nocardia yamanashiensis]UGT38787.1 DUF389 domain-containing protein [Nocardia yamanashiensis]
MLRIRVSCPVESTARVLSLLAADSGVTRVSLTAGGSVTPPGDLVEADVARTAADDVFDGLIALGVTRTGALTFQPAEYQVAARLPRSGADDDALVWQETLQKAWRGAEPGPVYLTLLTIALLLAVVGVATASPITIVGAMVVGPEYGPLAAIAVGLVRRERKLTRRGLLALAVGFPLAMLITAAATWVWIRLGWIDVGGVDNARQFDFIYEVGPFSLVVALLAGAAGMLAQITARSSALVGVFISVTTVPAAGLAVAAAFAGIWHVTATSLIQLAVNLIGIVVAGVVVLAIRPGTEREGGPLTRIRRRHARTRSGPHGGNAFGQ